MGSGIVWDKKGHILSNFHVVQNASSLRVIMSNGDEYDAKVVGVDPDHDIAVLRVDAPAKKLTPIPVGTSNHLKVGQKVLAIGNPFGFDCSLSVGVVSSLCRSMRSVTGITIDDVIQTDAAINSGNSGGPLLNGAGQLIGISTAIVSPTGGSVGIGFAIPVDMVSDIVPQLIAHGKIKRAGLGIQLMPDYIARRYGIRGAVIGEVMPNGAAAKSNLRGTHERRLGDVIVKIDDTAVESSVDLREILLQHKEGDVVTIVYQRGRRKVTARVTLQTLE
jgi:S1-C subfamily serine protease